MVGAALLRMVRDWSATSADDVHPADGDLQLDVVLEPVASVLGEVVGERAVELDGVHLRVSLCWTTPVAVGTTMRPTACGPLASGLCLRDGCSG